MGNYWGFWGEKMILIGILHIILSLIAYVGYLYITVKSFSKTNYIVLTITNITYFVGFILGIFWAKIEWGFYLNTDIKTILSISLFLPYFIENVIKTKRYYLPIAGMILLILNYILPALIYTIHIH